MIPRASAAAPGRAFSASHNKKEQQGAPLPPPPGGGNGGDAGGPYASRTDRDPSPAPIPSLSRGAEAGLDDEAYEKQSGAVAGGHMPGKTDEADRVAPPPEPSPAAAAKNKEQQYPLERDPSVSGGMATTAPPPPPQDGADADAERRARAAAARHGHGPKNDQLSQPHPPQDEIELPANPAAASCAGPYASRPDRDPWPAPMPCLSRLAGAGLDDSDYRLMSGAVAGMHTPGAHHTAADGRDVEDDDHVDPPPAEPLEMPAEEAAYAYPIDRDPCVRGGMATHAPAGGATLPRDF